MKLRDYVIGANASMYYRLNFKKIKGVFYPRTEQELVEIIKHAKENGYGITPKGGGSGLSGACTGGDKERIMISSLQMNQIISISKDQGYVDVQPGATPDEINKILEPLKLKFWVAPSSRDIASVGGIISTDGGGNDTWQNGTMRDNTMRIKMVLYDGSRLTVDWKGVRCENNEIENELNKLGMTIHDVAGCHGTLGFISELRVNIRPFPAHNLIGGVAHYQDLNQLGKVLTDMIEEKCPIWYGEVIAEAHKDVRGDMKPPLLILEFPDDYTCDLKGITDFEPITKEELKYYKDVRLKLPKRNPKEGMQVALFEGYGFYGTSLLKMQDCVNEINDLLRSHDLEPFAKYGHGPSKWYIGDNSPTYGIVLHSREIRPPEKSGVEIFNAVTDIVELCKKLGVTPKPEHKWPFSDDVKNARLRELRNVIGGGFNEFILDPRCNDILASMV